MGNMVLSSAFIIFIGPFEENFRKKIIPEW